MRRRSGGAVSRVTQAFQFLGRLFLQLETYTRSFRCWHGPVDPKPTRLVALALARAFRPLPPPAYLRENTYESNFVPIQTPPNPQSKPGQANPNPAKLIQIKMLGFTWFYSSDSGLINGLQRFPNRIFPLALRPAAKPRLARHAFGSDYRHNVGHFLIFTRGESKNCVVSLSRFLFRPPLRIRRRLRKGFVPSAPGKGAEFGQCLLS